MQYTIIGAGLAGCECALLLADAGIQVKLYEQKPSAKSAAHNLDSLAELVCSNSFRSNDPLASGVGLLKEEMRQLDSPLLAIAEEVKVPAGKALAVDRHLFSEKVSARIKSHENICLIEEEVIHIEDLEISEENPLIIAAGPMASEKLVASLQNIIEDNKLYFYDAIAPIIDASSVDSAYSFYGSRYGHEAESEEEIKAQGDYLNCPMDKEEYHIFWQALVDSERVPAHNFEKEKHFEGCMPIEALADRGEKTLTFGSFKPVGFIDPKTGQRPYAIVQLRKEDSKGSAYNIVGCQTKMTYKAQDEVFRLIPALKNVEFLRYGSVHRNTYVHAPKVLNKDLSLQKNKNIYMIGQITGVEGYVESIATGLYLAVLLIAKNNNKDITRPPQTTALGGLLTHLETENKNFQPSNAHFGLMPELAERTKKKDRKEALAKRAKKDFIAWLEG